MDTALPQKFPFILDRNLAKANYRENRICTSCDTVVLGTELFLTDVYDIIVIVVNTLHRLYACLKFDVGFYC